MILDAASAVIQQNRNRKDKRLYTERKGGAQIVYFRGSDDLEEADFVSRTVRARDGGGRAANVAVLYRMNAQSRAVEDALMRDGIPYRIVGGVRFYERKEIKDALAYLKLILNPHDDVSFRRVVNVPARGIAKTRDGRARRHGPDGARQRRAAARRGRPAPGGVVAVAVGADRAPAGGRGSCPRARTSRCARSTTCW